jgi:hypothetical protein
VLREVQRVSYDDLNDNWRSKGIESLCSCVNDNERMQEKCSEFADIIETRVLVQETRVYLLAILEELANEYISLAVTSANFLAKSVLQDLDEPVFSKLFYEHWEGGTNQLCEVLVATLDDYFNDVKEWLPEFFFNKFVKDIFLQVILIYIMGIRKHAIVITSGSNHNTINFPHIFNSEMNAASRISNDYEIIKKFFGEYQQELHQGGLHDMNEELEPLKQLAYITIVSKLNSAGVEDNVKKVFSRYGKEGLSIVVAAICCNPSMNKNEKIHNIKLANDLFVKKETEYPILGDIFQGISSLAMDTGVDIAKLKSLALKPKSKFSDWIRRGGKSKKADDDGDY